MTSRSLLSLAAAAVAAGLLSGCGADTGDTAVDTPDPSATTVVPGCRLTPPKNAPTTEQYDAPPMTLDPAKTYTAVMDTSCGKLTFTLDSENAPIAVNSFVFLAGKHFFDGLRFHRIIPGFMAQGGDPTGQGTGGPGYEFDNETPTRPYEVGDLAMANAGLNTNGSQFFIVTGDHAQMLPPNYTLFGQVTKGRDTLARLDALGDPNADNGIPTRQPGYIYSVRVSAK